VKEATFKSRERNSSLLIHKLSRRCAQLRPHVRSASNLSFLKAVISIDRAMTDNAIILYVRVRQLSKRS
jgi:hypothetical protein